LITSARGLAVVLGDYSADAFGVARGSSNKCAWGKARLAALSSRSIELRSFPVRAAESKRWPRRGGAERVTRLYRAAICRRPIFAARAGLVSGLPLMHRTSYIRLARVKEAAALSDLCFRSKGGVGLRSGVYGADARRRCARAPANAPGALDLNKLFVEPRHIRGGVGRCGSAEAPVGRCAPYQGIKSGHQGIFRLIRESCAGAIFKLRGRLSVRATLDCEPIGRTLRPRRTNSLYFPS
jgi:hypothetical protein